MSRRSSWDRRRSSSPRLPRVDRAGLQTPALWTSQEGAKMEFGRPTALVGSTRPLARALGESPLGMLGQIAREIGLGTRVIPKRGAADRATEQRPLLDLRHGAVIQRGVEVAARLGAPLGARAQLAAQHPELGPPRHAVDRLAVEHGER